MTNYGDVCSSWVARLQGQDVKARQTERVWYDGHRIFSYGTHFEMARGLRNKDGSLRAFLINGDVWGTPSTARHQSEVRHAIGSSGVPSVIIPYRALNSAGIDYDSVELVDVQADGWEETVHTYRELQPRWQWRREDMTDYVPYTDEERAILAEQDYLCKYSEWVDREARRAEWHAQELAKGKENSIWAHRSPAPERVPAEKWGLDRSGHSGHSRSRWLKYGTEWRVYTAANSSRTVAHDYDEDGIYFTFTTRRHWLGGSLIKARVPYTQIIRCKTCRKHPGRAYGPAQEERRCVGYDHIARESIWEPTGKEDPEQLPRCPDCNRHDGRIFRSRSRVAYFLSSFDDQEPRRSYFFCELPPKVAPTTVAEALECLKPDPVRLAEQMGREVRRQGDIFAIPLTLTKRQLRKQGARFEKRGQLLNTNHVATETAYLPDGTTLARGALIHAPQRRSPDHVRVRLGNVYHVVVKNTVPLAA